MYKTRSNIEDTYIFPCGSDPDDAAEVYAYGSFLVGKSTENGNNRALLRFKNLPDIGKGSILYAATMYIWQYQYSSGVFSTDDENSMTKKTYSAINVYLQYDNQVNQVLFDGMQLVRDDGESYVYDSEGNLISAVSAAEKSHFVFDGKDSLTRMGNIDGTAFDYGYDTKKHLVNASNSEGVRYRFTYDEKGMPTGMTVEGGKHLASVTPGRIYYIRDQYSGHYMEV